MSDYPLYQFIDELKALMQRYNIKEIKADSMGKVGLVVGERSTFNGKAPEEAFSSFYDSISGHTSSTDFYKK